jgi:hypothetical protein
VRGETFRVTVPLSRCPLAALSSCKVRGRTGATLLGSLLLVAAASPALGAKTPPLTLNVAASAPTYNVGDQVVLTVTVTNSSTAPVTASVFAPGSLRVVGLKRDGVKIPPTTTLMNFDEDPNFLRVEALTSIAPGGNAAIPFDVDLDGAVGVIITTVKLAKGPHEHKASVYRLTGPGLYTLSLDYHYTGPDNGQPNVFHGTLKSNEVSFRLN